MVNWAFKLLFEAVFFHIWQHAHFFRAEKFLTHRYHPCQAHLRSRTKAGLELHQAHSSTVSMGNGQSFEMGRNNWLVLFLGARYRMVLVNTHILNKHSLVTSGINLWPYIIMDGPGIAGLVQSFKSTGFVQMFHSANSETIYIYIYPLQTFRWLSCGI